MFSKLGALSLCFSFALALRIAPLPVDVQVGTVVELDLDIARDDPAAVSLFLIGNDVNFLLDVNLNVPGIEKIKVTVPLHASVGLAYVAATVEEDGLIAWSNFFTLVSA